MPGVRAVSLAAGHVQRRFESTSIEVEGYTPKGDNDRGSAVDVVGPGYFSALGVPITLGRDILESGPGDSLKVCVINEAFVGSSLKDAIRSGCACRPLTAEAERHITSWA